MNLFITPLSKIKIKTLNKLKLKKYRYSSKSYLCEGWRLFSAASFSVPQKILEVILNKSFSKSNNYSDVLDFCEKRKIPVYICADKEFKTLSDEKSPSGLMFVMSLDYFQDSDVKNISDSQCIYLENVADPGNLGTIIRSAAWFGIETILLSPASLDPFNPKVVRASSGGIFGINIYLNISVDTVSKFGLNNGYKCIGTTVDNGTKLYNWKVADKNIIFFGNEANGLTNSAKELLSKKLSISGSGKLESLNLSVSAGIILNHLYKEIQKKK